MSLNEQIAKAITEQIPNMVQMISGHINSTVGSIPQLIKSVGDGVQVTISPTTFWTGIIVVLATFVITFVYFGNSFLQKFDKIESEIKRIKSDHNIIKAGEFNESSTLSLNTSLVSKHLILKVTLPQSSKPQEKEAETTCNTLHQDRKYYMECTIVRIMKARKVMKHNALVDEIIKQTQSRFMPDIQFVKKNIEALIDKLYIQRTDQNDEYEYIS